MRSILSRIAAFLRALPRLVYERVCVAGEWLVRVVAFPTEPMAADVPAAEVADSGADNEHVAAIRAIAAHLLARQVPDPALSGSISEDEFDWLLACTPQMLRSIIAAERKALRDHIRGKRAIRGALVNDPRTVRAFVDDLVDEDGVELTPRTMVMAR